MSNRPGPKNPVLAAILGFAFGAFGLLYVNVNLAAAFLLFKLLGGVATMGIAAPLIWLACGFVGYGAAVSHNEKWGYQ